MDNTESREIENSPPLFKRWRGWYLVLVGVLLLQMLLYTLLSNWAQ